ncbi:MAG TPA: hypothetical protein VGV87_21160 [Blastocatellia bacterium]|nr:hypothetical protein [Blastocatellia bacterium]
MRGLIGGRFGTEDKCPRDYSYPEPALLLREGACFWNNHLTRVSLRSQWRRLDGRLDGKYRNAATRPFVVNFNPGHTVLASCCVLDRRYLSGAV